MTHASFYQNLDYFRKLIGDDVVSTQIVYAGKDELPIPNNGFVNYLHLK